MSQYQLIVFDWDGTLMDSTGHIVSCMQTAIGQLDLAPLSDSAIRHIIGLGLSEAVQTLYPDASALEIETLANQYRTVWLNSPHEMPLYDNALPLLNELSQQEYFLAVATGKSRKGLNKVLKSTQLETLFHATRCADECHSKPHPAMLEELMDFVGVLPKHTLMIGDTEFDLQMANNAGTDSLGISHGAHGIEILSACEPLDIVDDLYGVQTWLKHLS